MADQKQVKVFVSFITPYLYGMERSIIQQSALLQPEIISHLFMTYTTQRLNLPVLDAVKTAGIPYSFLSDKTDWPMLRKPRSFREALSIIRALILGSRDAFFASRGFDILYTPSLRSIYSLLPTLIAYRLLGKPTVYAFHDTLGKPSRLLQYIGPLVSHYIFYSNYTKSQFVAHNSWATMREMPVIPNVVTYNPTSAPSPLLSYPKSILYLGQIARYKGADLLIEAFRQISATYPTATLHFLGEPHTDFKSDFDSLISSADLAGRVVHWGYREDVHDFLKEAYIFVQPSRPSMFAESFGRGVVEAMAAGVPSVCFKSGALTEHVLDGETGLVCNDETAECLAANLHKLLDDEHLRDRLGSKAQERYQKHYAVDVIRQRWVTYFQGLKTKI